MGFPVRLGAIILHGKYSQAGRIIKRGHDAICRFSLSYPHNCASWNRGVDQLIQEACRFEQLMREKAGYRPISRATIMGVGQQQVPAAGFPPPKHGAIQIRLIGM
jgi:hypothetical protein